MEKEKERIKIKNIVAISCVKVITNKVINKMAEFTKLLFLYVQYFKLGIPLGRKASKNEFVQKFKARI